MRRTVRRAAFAAVRRRRARGASRRVSAPRARRASTRRDAWGRWRKSSCVRSTKSNAPGSERARSKRSAVRHTMRLRELRRREARGLRVRGRGEVHADESQPACAAARASCPRPRAEDERGAPTHGIAASARASGGVTAPSSHPSRFSRYAASQILRGAHVLVDVAHQLARGLRRTKWMLGAPTALRAPRPARCARAPSRGARRLGSPTSHAGHTMPRT